MSLSKRSKLTPLPADSLFIMVVAWALVPGWIGHTIAQDIDENQLCFDIFSGSKIPTLQCADADFFLDEIAHAAGPVGLAFCRFKIHGG